MLSSVGVDANIVIIIGVNSPLYLLQYYKKEEKLLLSSQSNFPVKISKHPWNKINLLEKQNCIGKDKKRECIFNAFFLLVSCFKYKQVKNKLIKIKTTLQMNTYKTIYENITRLILCSVAIKYIYLVLNIFPGKQVINTLKLKAVILTLHTVR